MSQIIANFSVELSIPYFNTVSVTSFSKKLCDYLFYANTTSLFGTSYTCQLSTNEIIIALDIDASINIGDSIYFSNTAIIIRTGCGTTNLIQFINTVV